MGKDLSDSFPPAKEIFEKADKVLGFSISNLCFNGPLEELTKTNNCQPAIVTMSIACWQAYLSRNPKVDGYLAGLSLGEYSALVASGALNFEDAVYLVWRRGQFMEEEALAHPGKMLSLIGLDQAIVKQICSETKTEIANFNCPGQIVISGGTNEIIRAQELAKAKGAKLAILLEVSGAFHSSFMQGASVKLAGELDKIRISVPVIPLVSNVTAKPVNTTQEIKENLVRQVASCVLWEDSMKFILSQGVTNFIEFGPGKVLKGLMRRINASASVKTIEKRDDLLFLA